MRRQIGKLNSSAQKRVILSRVLSKVSEGHQMKNTLVCEYFISVKTTALDFFLLKDNGNRFLSIFFTKQLYFVENRI